MPYLHLLKFLTAGFVNFMVQIAVNEVIFTVYLSIQSISSSSRVGSLILTPLKAMLWFLTFLWLRSVDRLYSPDKLMWFDACLCWWQAHSWEIKGSPNFSTCNWDLGMSDIVSCSLAGRSAVSPDATHTAADWCMPCLKAEGGWDWRCQREGVLPGAFTCMSVCVESGVLHDTETETVLECVLCCVCLVLFACKWWWPSTLIWDSH